MIMKVRKHKIVHLEIGENIRIFDMVYIGNDGKLYGVPSFHDMGKCIGCVVRAMNKGEVVQYDRMNYFNFIS
jgi:hypothetical protein